MPYVTSVERIGYQRGYREGYLEGWEVGWKEGWKEGWEEGRGIGSKEDREESRHAEASAFVQKVLRRRFGELSPDIAERISALPLEHSEDLSEALLDFTTVADLEAWLRQH